MAESGIPSASNTGNPQAGFFHRLRETVGENIFSRSLAIWGPIEWSRSAILDGSDIPLNEREDIDFYKLKPDELRDLSTRSHGRPIIILVEDITRDCVELLDAAFGLDPLFLLAYERGVSASQNVLPDDFQDLANRLREADGIFFDDGPIWTVRTRDLSTYPTTFRDSCNVSRSVSRRWIAACSWSVSKTRKPSLLTVLLYETHRIFYDRPCSSHISRSLAS